MKSFQFLIIVTFRDFFVKSLLRGTFFSLITTLIVAPLLEGAGAAQLTICAFVRQPVNQCLVSHAD